MHTSVFLVRKFSGREGDDTPFVSRRHRSKKKVINSMALYYLSYLTLTR